MRRLSFVPGPAGFRFYHTHLTPRADLSGGQYSGQVGPVYIEPRQHAGADDQGIFLTLKEFEPTFSVEGDMAGDFLAGDEDPALRNMGEQAMASSLRRGMPHGYEVGYDTFAINGPNAWPRGSDPRARRSAGADARAQRQRNATDDIHPIHLHRNTFEITRVAGTPTGGVRKDVAMLGGYQAMEIDFVADQPGLSVFHCHQQLHMDYGFMAL